MLGRRRIDTSVPIRSSLADAAFAVEERVVWGGAEALRGAFDVVKWPFERLAWAIERGLVWPLVERSGDWSAPVRLFGTVALALLAVAAGTLGLVLAAGGGGTAARQAAPPLTAPPARHAAKPEGAAPLLHGARPDFAAEAEGGANGAAAAGSGAHQANSTAEVATSGVGTAAAPATAATAGPASISVARRFADAFVLYEIGRTTPAVRAAFGETATPELARSLLRHPPRLPASARVPEAKVLNVVAGPRRGSTSTVSVSLLRVGVTSELRLDMQLDPKTHEWRIASARG